MLARIATIIIKELQSLLRDKKSKHILIFPPIIQLLIFSYAATLDVSNASIGICSEDLGCHSTEIQQRLYGAKTFAHITFYQNMEKASHALLNQKISCIIHFDSTFSRKIASGNAAQLQCILDGRKSNTTQILLGYLQRIISQYNQDTHPSPSFPAVLIQRNWYNENLIYQWFTVPGLVAILGMITSLTATSLTVAKERELGTFDQLLVAPLRPLEILLGKSLPGIIVGLIEATIILLAAVFIFKIPFTGSIIAFYLALIIFITAIVGIGIFLSSVSQTQQQAFMKVFFFISPAIILSGFATPIANMPIWLQKVTIINPLKYFLIVSRGTFLKQMSLIEVLPYMIPMALIAFVTLSGACFFFRRRLF